MQLCLACTVYVSFFDSQTDCSYWFVLYESPMIYITFLLKKKVGKLTVISNID